MKLLSIIIKVALFFVLVLTLIGIIFTSLFGEKIEQYMLKNIREKSIVDIVVKDVSFSVFENFPYASVKLTDVLILETESNQEDTLLYVNQGYLQFNIFNLISKDRKISKIVLLDSELNIRYDKDGNPNFKIFKQSDQQEEKIKLNQVYLNNCFISYFHESKEADISGKTDKILLQFNNYQHPTFLVKGDLFFQKLSVAKNKYIYNKQTKIDAVFAVNDGIFQIKKSNISIEDVNFNLQGNIQNKTIDLNFKSENQQLKSVLLHAPENFKNIYKSFTLDGILNCDGVIKGVVSETSTPHFNMDFAFAKADFKLKENPFYLTDLELSGNINNGTLHNFEQTIIKVTNLSFKCIRDR